MRKSGLIIIMLALLAGTAFWIESKRSKPADILPEGTKTLEGAVSSEAPPASSKINPGNSEPEAKAPIETQTPSMVTGKTETPSDKNCFVYEFKHKEAAKNRDIEDFLDFSNAFPIAHANVNPKSICVKVNQKAVPFQTIKTKSDQQEIMLGSVVGPESLIRISYCIGKARCKEDCNLPKKRFMDDLMSDAGQDDPFSDSWSKGAGEDGRKELTAKKKELRNLAAENKNLNDRAVMRDWNTQQKQEWVCKEK